MLGHDALGVRALGGAPNPPATAGAGVLAFTLTLNSAGLKSARKLSVEALSFTYTVNAVTFRRGFALTAEPLNFFLTLNAVDFLTGQRYLPRASAGLNFTLFVREAVLVKARGGDTIYNGASTGATLSSV